MLGKVLSAGFAVSFGYLTYWLYQNKWDDGVMFKTATVLSGWTAGANALSLFTDVNMLPSGIKSER